MIIIFLCVLCELCLPRAIHVSDSVAYCTGVRDIKDPFPVNNRDLRQGQGVLIDLDELKL